jgi:hypothetical protein
MKRAQSKSQNPNFTLLILNTHFPKPEYSNPPLKHRNSRERRAVLETNNEIPINALKFQWEITAVTNKSAIKLPLQGTLSEEKDTSQYWPTLVIPIA